MTEDEAPSWIRIEDSVPKEMQDVFVWLGGNKQRCTKARVARFRYRYGYRGVDLKRCRIACEWVGLWKPINPEEVTHWMPIHKPAPNPKRKKPTNDSIQKQAQDEQKPL